MLGARLPVAVGGLVVVHQAERLVRIAFFNPLQGVVGDNVRHVPLVLLPLAHLDHHRVVILSLPRQHVPVVESRRIASQVPFADQRGLIAGLLQQLGEGLLTAVEGLPAVVDLTVDMAVLTRQNHRPAGGADGIRTKAVVETHAFVGDPVEIRRLINLAAVAAHGVRGVIVRHNIDDIRLFVSCILAEAIAAWQD